MRYVFVKVYNPAYDFFLTTYFQRSGIPFDESTPFEEAEEIADRIKKKGEALTTRNESARGPLAFLDHLPASEALFWRYVWHWGRHPEERPAVYGLLSVAAGIASTPNLPELKEMESRLPAGKGKLVLSEDEASGEIADFYKRQIAAPLKRALAEGADANELADYFSAEELRQLPKRRAASAEDIEREANSIAGQITDRHERITPEEVRTDIETLAEAHDRTRDHMRKAVERLSGKKRESMVCEHVSGSVTLRGRMEQGEAQPTLLLTPTRVPTRPKDDVNEDWEDVLFPTYWLLTDTSHGRPGSL